MNHLFLPQNRPARSGRYRRIILFAAVLCLVSQFLFIGELFRHQVFSSSTADECRHSPFRRTCPDFSHVHEKLPGGIFSSSHREKGHVSQTRSRPGATIDVRIGAKHLSRLGPWSSKSFRNAFEVSLCHGLMCPICSFFELLRDTPATKPSRLESFPEAFTPPQFLVTLFSMANWWPFLPRAPPEGFVGFI